ncbi:MAG: DUF1320 domain-containing protein [Burkholderiales bacterium]|nr:DUF1320 domain-containing protein [Burkholderiales bacterium]
MAYAVQADLETRFGAQEIAQLTDRDGGVFADAAVVDRALSDAQALIDSYLAARYPLPLAPVPDVINRMCCDIARYYLHEDRVTEQVRQRYEDCVSLLQAIARGVAELSLAGGGAPPAPSGGSVVVSAPARTFNVEQLSDY